MMLAAQYGTVSDIELVWTLLALVGAMFSLHNLIQAKGDLTFLRENKIPNGRLTLAKFTFKAECARFVIQSIFFAVGIGAMTLADPPNQLALPIHLIIVQALFRWGLVISAGLVTLKSYWAWQVRKELIKDRETRIAVEEAQALSDFNTKAAMAKGERDVAAAREGHHTDIYSKNVHVQTENVELNGD